MKNMRDAQLLVRSQTVYIGLGLVVAISILVISGLATPFDTWLLAKFDAGQTPSELAFWTMVSELGKPLTIGTLTVLVSLGALALGKRSAFWFLVICGGISFASEPVLKFIVHRARPVELYPETLPQSWSFPSGHAMFSMTFYLSVAYVLSVYASHKISIIVWISALMMAFMIALSRLELGVHYLSDVFAGALLGYVIVAAGLLLHSPAE